MALSGRMVCMIHTSGLCVAGHCSWPHITVHIWPCWGCTGNCPHSVSFLLPTASAVELSHWQLQMFSLLCRVTKRCRSKYTQKDFNLFVCLFVCYRTTQNDVHIFSADAFSPAVDKQRWYNEKKNGVDSNTQTLSSLMLTHMHSIAWHQQPHLCFQNCWWDLCKGWVFLRGGGMMGGGDCFLLDGSIVKTQKCFSEMGTLSVMVLFEEEKSENVHIYPNT